MKTSFGTEIHRAQVVMELDISQLDDINIAKKIMQYKPVISLQHFIAGGANDNAAVIIWNGNKPIKKIIGKWELHHTTHKKNYYSNYFSFTPICNVKSCALEIVDENTEEYYLFYTFDEYKKL